MALDPVESSVPAKQIPISMLPPVYTQPLDGLLHCFALDSSQEQTVHVTIDATGTVKELPTLPLSVGGLTACGKQLLVTGQASGDYRPVAMAIGPDGHLDWQYPFKPDQSLRLAHQPVCLGQSPTVVWLTDDDELLLWLMKISKTGAHPPTSIRLEGTAYGFSLIASRDQMWIGCLAGLRLRFEALEVAGGQIRQRKTVIDSLSSVQPGVAAVGDRYVVAWASVGGQELCLRWFDSQFAPLSPVEKLATISEPATLRTIQLYASAGGSLAVSYLTTRTGELESSATGRDTVDRYVETEIVEHKLLMIQDGHSASSFSIVPPGSVIHAGNWLDNRFMLLHGDDSTYLSRF